MTSSDGWQKVRFGEVVRNVNTTVSDPLGAGLERTVGLDDLDSNSLALRRSGDLSIGTTFTKRFRPGQVLFGKRRAYQRKVAVADFDGVCSGDILVLEAVPETLRPELLPFIAQSDAFFDHALRTSRGSLSPRTSWRDLSAFEIDLPPLDQQRRIADLLWALEGVLDSLVALDGAISELEAAFIKEEVCSAAHPRSQLSSVVTNITPGKSLISSNKPAQADEYGVLKISAVGPRGFVARENKCLLDQGAFRPEFRVAAGDFLVTRCNTRELVGRACVVPGDQGNLMLSDKTLRLGFDPDGTDATFLLAAFRSPEVRTQIESRATGTGGAMKNLSQQDFQSLRIPLPQVDTQRSIALILATHAHARSAIDVQIADSQRLRQTFISQELPGRGVPT